MSTKSTMNNPQFGWVPPPPTPKPKSRSRFRKALPLLAAAGVALIVGVAMGSGGTAAPAAGPAPATVTAQAAAVTVRGEAPAPVTVTETADATAPQACLDAVDDADQVQQINSDAFGIDSELFDAASRLDSDKMDELNTQLEAKVSELDAPMSAYQVDSALCRAQGS